MSVKKEDQRENVGGQEGLSGSAQTFHAFASFEAVNGTVVMRTPEEMKKINPRRYRDRIFGLEAAVRKYVTMGLTLRRMKYYGARGMDELKDILDDFGMRIVEAASQLRKDQRPVPPAVDDFCQKYMLYKSSGGALIIG